jgi:hypothetical protein
METAAARATSPLDRFVGATLTAALIVFGALTCLTILLTIDPGLGNRVLFRGALDTDGAAGLVLRHWGFMVFGVGALMIASAFRPWLRFAALAFALAEKALLVALVLGNQSQPWGAALLPSALLDGVISIYCVLYFVSAHGRPQAWVRGGAG